MATASVRLEQDLVEKATIVGKALSGVQMLADNPGLGRSCDEIYPNVFISQLENIQLISPKKKAYETPNVELLSDSMLLKIAIAR